MRAVRFMCFLKHRVSCFSAALVSQVFRPVASLPARGAAGVVIF
ncbi:hypothetical protein HMPREF1979_02175 [Actinomyces johnsonii F0542]|uniref:Uncharacterized protein n=1 Tax=Actinomyces johnsonii F0542 TaxID=1321818 RepID=U1QL32_9ACTO|nr:hypothetical protein HMPREF1979_02175 [Actinomyces johnsonii F0542]